ncbi:MAG: hypothetical protein ABSG16_22435 [Candidatus Acidiferrum sp.]|jgi:hypothetical protein
MSDFPKSVVGYSFGPSHRWWMTRPSGAACIALVLYFIVIMCAGHLGILPRKFASTSVDCSKSVGADYSAGGLAVTADGFLVGNWGILYLFAMPLAAFLMGRYFGLLDRALVGLDNVIKPVPPTERPFSEFLVERIRLQWSGWIFPLSLAIPLILTIVADGRDILAPLQSKAVLPSCTADWSTVGWSAHPHSAALWYFGFNLLAWVMQIFIAYCGVLSLALTGGVLGTVFSYGLGNRAVIDLFLPPGAPTTPAKYCPEWQYCKARCGLEALDVVFLWFVVLNFVALIASAESIFVNVYLRNNPTVGSIILAIGTMVFIPLSAFFVFVPYLSKFPDDFPAGFVANQTPCFKPTPWPFGSEKFSWVALALTASFWLFLLTALLRALFPAMAGHQSPN